MRHIERNNYFWAQIQTTWEVLVMLFFFPCDYSRCNLYQTSKDARVWHQALVFMSFRSDFPVFSSQKRGRIVQ